MEKRMSNAGRDGEQYQTQAPPPTYNMLDILRQSDSPGELDLPETAVKVTVRESSHGRGVFATEDILPGELLVVSKALGIVYPSQPSLSTSSLWREVEKLGRLREELRKLIETDGSKALEVYHLYAGPQLGYLELEEAQRLQGCVDCERVERICSFNAFQGNSTNAAFGLWYFPSFLNHDCLRANGRWTIVNNYMFIRALRPITKDTEVIIAYVDPNDSVTFRRNFFLKHGFVCTCALCLTERSEGQCVRRRREIILDEFKSAVVTEDDVAIGSIDTVIRELEGLRPMCSHLNVFIIQPLVLGGLSHYEKGHYELALPYFLRAFDLSSISAQISLLCISCAFTIATCFLRRNKPTLAAQWVGIAKTWVFNIYGTLDMIQILRPSFYKEMTLHQLL